MSKLSIKRPITTIMIILMVVMAGIISYFNLDLALMPTIEVPIAGVMTTYTGAGPEEMEELITKPLEEAMVTINNVDKVSSISSNGSAFVIIQFEDDTNIDLATIDIRDKIDQVKGRLPDAANDPMVLKFDINAQPIMVGITSEKLDLASLNTLVEEEIERNFERIEGVAAVDISGGIEKEIEIVVIPDKMEGYGVTTQQISQALSAENINLPAGNIQQGTAKLQIRAVGEFTSIDQIRNLPIKTGAGSVINIRDVANVEEVTKDKDSYSLINNKEGIALSIDKQSTANVVDVSDKIVETIHELGQRYPEIELTLLTSTADHIKRSVNNVIMTAFQSAMIAILVLFLFLGDIKTALIIGVSIPTSIMATFGLIYLKGMTMNTISMGGIVIGIGMLVDNSVVVLENIFSYWKQGLSPRRASEKGAKEVAMAVLGSTLTTVAVFLPLIFMPGMMGTLLQDLAFTICFALGASYVVAITFVPMACSLVLKVDDRINKKNNIFSKIVGKWMGGLDALDGYYRTVLGWSLKNKKKTVAITLLVFFGSLAIVPLVGMELMPASDEGTARISLELPKGSILEETEKTMAIVLERIQDIEELEMVYATVGAGQMGGGTNTGNITLNLVPLKERQRSTDEVSEEIKQLVSNIPGAEITVTASAMAMGALGEEFDLSMQVTGEETDTLRQVSQDIMDEIWDIEGVTEVESSSESTVPEANIVINRNKASQYGISTSAIASAINTAVTGNVATQYKVDGSEIDVRIRHDKGQVNYINDIKNINISTGTGSVIPITEVADISMKQSSESISRENLKRYITVEANVHDKDQGTFKSEVEAKLATYIFPEGYGYEFTGSLLQMEETFTSLGIILIVATLLVYMIMASQFESLVHPFIIMLSMPIAITGGILGLFITGQHIGVTAFMGFIMLVGMVVNNGIVLVDYANQLVENKGLSSIAALIEAGPSRLRPILMTTLTTIIGLLPMAIGAGQGMETQRPLAIAVIFGLALSTLITLVFIPVLYQIVEQIKLKRKQRKQNKKQKKLKNQTV